MNCESACGDVVVCGSTLKINHLYFDLSVNHIPAVLSHTLLFWIFDGKYKTGYPKMEKADTKERRDSAPIQTSLTSQPKHVGRLRCATAGCRWVIINVIREDYTHQLHSDLSTCDRWRCRSSALKSRPNRNISCYKPSMDSIHFWPHCWQYQHDIQATSMKYLDEKLVIFLCHSSNHNTGDLKAWIDWQSDLFCVFFHKRQDFLCKSFLVKLWRKTF